MDSIKVVLVFLVITVCYIYGRNNIETFFPQIQNLPFLNIPVTNTSDLLMCKDKNDLPYSCHGQGVSQSVFNKYKNNSYSCPKDWLIKKNSIYL